MTKKLTYKNYTGSVEYSEEDGVFFGKLLYITDLILYEAESKEGLQKSFENAVDEYLSDCKLQGRTPNEPCKGSFNVRVDPETHLQLKFLAVRKGVHLNEVVRRACIAAIEADKIKRTYEFAPVRAASWKSDGFPGGIGLC
jgi:predicted HicB family RNase H-like nuclease